MNHVDDVASFGKVAVLMGGTSGEREISLRSGQAVYEALIRSGVDAHIIDAQGMDVLETLSSQGYDRVFNILHGRGGEDGVIQGALDMLGMPYTGSGVMASAIGMDKLRTKLIWRGAGLPTPPSVTLLSQQDLDGVADEVGYPLIIKPAHEGSSLGMSKVMTSDDLLDAWQKASRFDSEVFAERWVQGSEYTVAILQGPNQIHQALPVIRVETPHDFYDFDAKYRADNTGYHCPSGLDQKQELALQQLAVQAFNIVGCSGWGRVDVMLDETGQTWLIEVNTNPGMTDHSLVPMAAQAAGIDFDSLVLRVLETTMNSEVTG